MIRSVLFLLAAAPAVSLAAEPDSVQMDLAAFLKLYESAQNRPDKPEKAPRQFALAAADYAGTVVFEDEAPVSAVFDATLRVDVLKKEGWVTVPLLPATVAVQRATINGAPAPLVLEGGYYNIVPDKKGGFDVKIQFATAVETTAGSSGFSFQLVPAGATTTSVAVPTDEDLEFTVVNARLKEERTVGSKRIVEATLPSTGSLAVRWQREIPEEVAQEPRLYAEVYTLVGFGDGLVRATTTLQQTILFAGVDELKAQVPDGMTLLDVRGNGIRDWSMSDDNVLTVLLNYAAEGSYSMTLELEKVLGEGQQLSTEAPLVTPLGVERSKGWVGVQALGALELASGEVQGATPVDVRTLPASILGVTSQPVLLGYKYLGGDVGIPIDVYSHDEVDVLVTLLDQTRATTMFTRDGRRLTQVTYDVRNNRRQFLRLALPEGAELWSASVAGRAVQPAKAGDGRMLVPLIRSQAAGGNLASFPVSVVYVEQGSEPDAGGKGTFAAALPTADVPSTYVGWTVYAPEEAKISQKSFAGNLRHVDWLSEPIDSTTVMQVDTYNAPVRQGAMNQVSGGALGSGAAPVEVSLPVEGQQVHFEKLLALEESLAVSFSYKGLKD